MTKPTLLLAALSFTSFAALADSERPGLAVFDLKNNAAKQVEVDMATTSVVRGLRELDAFEVISSDDLRQMLSIERQRQLLGVESDSNISASAQALGIRHHITGSVTRSPAGLSGELRLLDTSANKIVAQRAVNAVDSLDKFASTMFTVSQELVGDLLKNELGQLVVRSREEGAEILVDEVMRGSTPLAAPISLSRGRHRVTVRKVGFIARVSTVLVVKDQVTVEDAILLPSADYIDAYKQRNSRLRIAAWITTGTTVAALIAGVLLTGPLAENVYTNEFKPRADILQQYALNGSGTLTVTNSAQQTCAMDLEVCRKQATELKTQISTFQTVGYIMYGVAAASAIASAYFWLSGQDPNRYAQLIAFITPNGGSIGVSKSW